MIEAVPAAVFTTETEEGSRLTQEEILRLSGLYAPLYARLVEETAKRHAASTGLPLEACEVFARRALPPLTHFFLDRLIRLDLMLKRRPSARSLPRALFPPAPERIEAFQALAHGSAAFNAAMLSSLGRLWSLEEAPAAAPAPAAEPGPSGAPFVNHNFEGASWPRRLARGLARRALKAASAIAPRLQGRHPALSMGYDANPLRGAGLYGFNGLADVLDAPEAPSVPEDPALRRAVLDEAAAACAGDLRSFLTQAGAAAGLHAAVSEAFAAHLTRMYPTSLLEGGPALHALSAARLAPLPGALFVEEMGDLRSIGMIAAARAGGRKVVGCQHGGIYGPLEDIAQAVELEYPLSDLYVTWGWERFPDHPACRRVRAVPLPNPWLSERARYWRRARPRLDAAVKEHDFLLMTNKVYPFPPAPSGADISRGEHLAAHAESLKLLLRETARRKLSVIHKPYSADAAKMMPRAMAELASIGGDLYRLSPRRDKGLTPELAGCARAVLWDQPTTGFMECLAGGIATMVYWPRAYNRERPAAREAVAALEAAGVIHRDPGSLCAAFEELRRDPAAWRREPARARAMAEFSRLFARTSDAWAAEWRAFLGSL